MIPHRHEWRRECGWLQRCLSGETCLPRSCAGWHIAKELLIPTNITPVFLPPYSPELNAIERVWLYLRERFLSHRLWPSYEEILDACCAAWNRLRAEPGRIRSLCSFGWLAPVTT